MDITPQPNYATCSNRRKKILLSSNKSLTWFLCQSITLLIGLLSANLLFAHHPVAAKFDLTSSVALTGHVTEIDWANPHVHIFIQVDDSSRSAGN